MHIHFNQEEQQQIKDIRSHFTDIHSPEQAVKKAVRDLIQNDNKITEFEGAAVNYKRHLNQLNQFQEETEHYSPIQNPSLIAMPSDAKLIKERNQYVTRIYNQLNREGYTHKAICSKMPHYGIFLKPRTIYAIVSGEYDRKSETTK